MANAKKSKSAGPNKKKFILSKSSLPAKEVVEAGAKEGLKLTTGYVYVVRSQASLKARAPKPAGKRAARKGAAKAVAAKASKAPSARKVAKEIASASKATKGGAHAEAFVDLVLEIGLARAENILREIRKVGPAVSARA